MSGLTEEAAVEGHDLIQHAEEEAGVKLPSAPLTYSAAANLSAI